MKTKRRVCAEPGSKPGAITVSVYKADITTGKIQKRTGPRDLYTFVCANGK
ncbi:hypothetical protein [Tunturiibacter lichenicola]|uniref:hypothetical protein n=1 Tax=Tunturiibacter lichenicola TaxID=2051959 RepID=UPI003D9AFABC